MRKTVPLAKRKLDVLIAGFFAFNFVFISYMFDLEQVLILDTSNFEYPVWPPAWIIDLSHWYGRNFDPALMARPPWWRATIWIDVLLFGPFYACAVWAYWRGHEWIRLPSIVWASVMLTNVTIIMFEEVLGPHASDSLGMVIAANFTWMLMPVVVMARMWNADHPFTAPVATEPAKADR